MTTDEGPLTITDAAKRIRTGELTPSSLLEICLARIDRYEPKVKAWVYIDRERARREADQLTTELKDGLDRGPLHGVPIGIKDIIDVYDMPTGCGSKLWANSYARKDATCVERLRQAGALILGKTVTTAYAYLDPPVTRNPWNLERTPGGSSSGSAAAVACGMCLGALGTQTGGSVIRPAAYCGVYSMKPSHGWADMDGILPLAPSLDHLGLMANSVSDLEIIYRTIREHRIDFLCEAEASEGYSSIYHHHITKDTPEKYTNIGITRDYFLPRCQPSVRSAYCDFFESMTSHTRPEVQIYEHTLHPAFESIPAAHLTIMATEAAGVHRDRYIRHPDDYPTKIRELIELGLKLTAADISESFTLRKEIWRGFDIVDRERNLVVPATPGSATGIETTGDPQFNSPWSFLGVSVIGMPVGWDDNHLPVGIQIMNPWRDASLLRTCRALEEIYPFPHRPIPRSTES
jgi:aspartyl-tRNA(Asn)/glutamyl-tRNA(Gln) amidotransferase subunit A